MITGQQSDTVLETLVSPDGDERVLIVRRADRVFSFRKQFRTDQDYGGPVQHGWPDDYVAETGWTPPGPYCGLYDSAEVAKWEALGNVVWVAAVQPRN